MDLAELRNRFEFHPALTDEKKNQHEAVRQGCLALAEFLNQEIEDCEELDTAIRRLEEVMFWANGAVARYDD
jgi:hypothetical protein